MMNRIMPESEAERVRKSANERKFISRKARPPTTSAYSTATDDTSVGVAMPPTIPPTMMKTSRKAVNAPAEIRITAAALRRGAAGPATRRVVSTATRISTAAITAAGSSPAMNSPPIETFAT